MEHDEHDYDPLAPPPTHNQTQQHDQTVPNLESRDSHDNLDQSNLGFDPRNFHDDDLPANFAREAAKNEFHDQDQFQQDGHDFQPNNPYGDEEEGFYQRQQHQEYEQDQDYTTTESDGSLGNSMNSNPFAQDDAMMASGASHRNEYGGGNDETPIMGAYHHNYSTDNSPVEDHQQQQQQPPQRLGDEVYEDEDDDDEDEEEGGFAREDLEERRYESSLPEQESYAASPPEADRYRDQQQPDDVVESQRLRDDEYLGQGQPQIETSAAVASGDVGFDDSQEECVEADAVKTASAMKQHEVMMGEEEEDSENENAGTFDYNKMDEEETTEDIVSGEEEEMSGGPDQHDSPDAGIDNHAFDDNDDDEAAEVVQRKVDTRGDYIEADESDSLHQQPETSVEAERYQDVEQIGQPSKDDHAEDSPSLEPEDRVPPLSDNYGDGSGDNFMKGEGEEEEEEKEIDEDEKNLMCEIKKEEDFEDQIPPRSDNDIEGIDCSGNNFMRGGFEDGGKGEEEEEEEEEEKHFENKDNFGQYGDTENEVVGFERGGDEEEIRHEEAMRHEEAEEEIMEKESLEYEEREEDVSKPLGGGSDEFVDEDRQMEYAEDRIVSETKEESYENRMEVKEEEYVRETTAAVESGLGIKAIDSNIDDEDEEAEIESNRMVDSFDSTQREDAQAVDYRVEGMREVEHEEGKEENDTRPQNVEMVVGDEQKAVSTELSAGGDFGFGEAEQQQQQQPPQQEQENVDVYGDEREQQLVDSTDQSASVEGNNTPSSIGGDFQAMTSLKEEEGGGGKPPRSFADMIEDMASPETIPQPLPSPPKPESMSQFDPLAPASDDEREEDDDLIMDKQQQYQHEEQQQYQLQQQEQGEYQQPQEEEKYQYEEQEYKQEEQGLYQQEEKYQQEEEQCHADLMEPSQVVDGNDYYESNHVTDDAREESSEDLCLRAGEIEGETKFGVDGSAITTSADQNVLGLGEEEYDHQQHENLGFDEDDDDEVVNTGLATDYTTTTTTTETTEEPSGAELESSSLGQAGFEQGFETGAADTDNALMSMSMEGSFYDDGGDVMGGNDGVNGGNEGSNLLIQSAITEVSEPTSSFSPHQESVLRSEQQDFQEKLSEQNVAEDMFSHQDPLVPEQQAPDLAGQEEEIKVQTTHESFASIPSGFEDQQTPVSSAVNDVTQSDVTSQKEDGFFEDERAEDVASQPITENGGVSESAGGDSFLDTPFSSTGLQTPETVDSPAAVSESFSSSVDNVGLQSQCNVGFEDSSNVDNSAGLVDNNSSAVNGYHHEESLISNESDLRDEESSSVVDVHEEKLEDLTPTDDALGKTETIDDLTSSEASQPPVSSSVDAVVAPTPAAAESKPVEEKKKPEAKQKKTTTKDKDKKDKPASKTTTSTAKKTPTTTATTKKTTTSKTTAATTSSTTTTRASRPTTTRPASAPAAKKSETTPKTTASTRKPTSATPTSATDKKLSPTKPTASSPGSGASKPLPRYAQPITPRKPRDSSLSAPASAENAKKPATPRPATTPSSTPRTRPSTATPKTTASSTSSRLSSTTTSSPRPKSSPTKLSNGTTPTSTTDKRSTSPTKKYGINATPRTPTTGTAKATEKKEVKASPRTPLSSATRSPTKTATPRTPSSSASTPRTGSATTNGKSATPKKPDYSNVTSRIGSKDKMTHKPGGGNVKIESRKLKVEAKSKIGSLDNASHKPSGGDKKVENGADGASPV